MVFAYWKIVGTLIALNSQTYLRRFQLLALFSKLLQLMIPSQLLLVHLLPFVPSNPAGTSLQDSHCYDLTTEHKMLAGQVSSMQPLRRLLSATYHSEQPCQVRVQLHNIIHTLVVVANTDALIVVDVSGLKDSLKSTDVGPYMRDSHVPDASKHRELYSGRSHNDKLQLRRVDIDDLREQSKRLLSADDCICATCAQVRGTSRRLKAGQASLEYLFPLEIISSPVQKGRQISRTLKLSQTLDWQVLS
jgi:hypothetical protein